VFPGRFEAGQESIAAGHSFSCSRTGGDGGGGGGSSRDEGGTEYDILPGEGDRTKQEGGDGQDAWGCEDRRGRVMSGGLHSGRDGESGISPYSGAGGEGHGN
jgi:hypothetical protein